MNVVENSLVVSIRITSDLSGRLRLHLLDDIEHLFETEAMLAEDRLCEVVEVGFAGLRENQGESLALQGGDESDNSPTFHRLIARQDIPHCANTHTIN